MKLYLYDDSYSKQADRWLASERGNRILAGKCNSERITYSERKRLAKLWKEYEINKANVNK